MARLKVLVIDSPDRQASGPSSDSLGRQGDLMLHALLADLQDLAAVELMPALTPAHEASLPETGASDTQAGAHLDARREPCRESRSESRFASRFESCFESRFGAQFGARLRAADAVWPLAFESAGWLEDLSRCILQHKRILLGSAPGAVQAAASKLALARLLAEAGVATAATYSPHAALPQDGGAWVVKPDDGAGCLQTLLFSDRGAALAWIRASAANGHVLQPFVPGKPGSLSLICRDGAARVLACNRQRVAMHDNRFHVLGTVVNGLADDDGALERLAQQVAAAIPSLWGYVGVDFVLTARGAVVLDVNPRLTVAYAGLRASIDCNPAALVLGLLQEPAAMPSAPGRRRPVNVDVGPPP